MASPPKIRLSEKRRRMVEGKFRRPPFRLRIGRTRRLKGWGVQGRTKDNGRECIRYTFHYLMHGMILITFEIQGAGDGDRNFPTPKKQCQSVTRCPILDIRIDLDKHIGD